MRELVCIGRKGGRLTYRALRSNHKRWPYEVQIRKEWFTLFGKVFYKWSHYQWCCCWGEMIEVTTKLRAML